ncbi:MAG: hypothetical protein US31_C0001G0012 [Berkelbacteria bacterium GW2011_GWA1_36_9]|uniref:Uncharacterized protein n=1 Tax=Berkelbacteria bacterium GW2011_GWA1_36_9 TaxID=1618331 RepID=A0A0G0FYG3_9BACT|nr:MAG: hypothetical protein US31_C0001G0012 [Berkelbacteria bacterium GW2011_GWA1_36_9]
MTLDKNDLKQIREIVREEVREVVREEVHDQIITEVPPIIEAKILPLKQKIDQIWDSLNEDLISNLTMIEKLSKKVKEMDSRIKKLELSK